MAKETGRAAALRQRAADLFETIKDLPAAEQREAMIRHKAIVGLADVEDWVTAAPRPSAAKYDYNLVPRPKGDTPIKESKPRGRVVRRLSEPS